ARTGARGAFQSDVPAVLTTINAELLALAQPGHQGLTWPARVRHFQPVLGAVERIEDPADPRMAPYRDLSDAELLQSRGLFVAEGRIGVRRVIEDARYRVRSL